MALQAWDEPVIPTNVELPVDEDPDVLSAIAAEAEDLDGHGKGASWANATVEERPRILADAARTRANVEQQARDGRLSKLAMEGYLREHPGWKPPLRDGFPEPEDRGDAELSDLGEVEYVEDLLRPGRIVVVAAEEGSGKSYAIGGELAIRIACAGGAFAGTWPVLASGPVVVVSEMHGDDDYQREAAILGALGRSRADLRGRYYRLALATAAGGKPALGVADWRSWIVGWLQEHSALLLVIDTATGATQVDPWGSAIQAAYSDLRAMIEDYPALAIVLVVHMKKPSGRGARRLSDVLGEWGRWCDVVVTLEAEGVTRTKVSTHKRIRKPRRIVATKRDGLLVEAKDADAEGGPKVPLEDVARAVAESPGIDKAGLAARLGVSARTVLDYVVTAEKAGLLRREKTGPRGAFTFYPSEAPRERATPRDEAARAVLARSEDVEDGATVRARDDVYTSRGRSHAQSRPPDESSESSALSHELGVWASPVRAAGSCSPGAPRRGAG